MTQTTDSSRTSDAAGGSPGGAADVGPLPPYDPECGAVLAVVLAQGATPPSLRSLEDIQTLRPYMMQLNAPQSEDALTRGGAYTVTERQAPGPAGAPEITLLICTPTFAPAPTPVLYHTHGGGMVVGNRRSGLEMIMDLAEPLGATVVSVEYRLAPENPYPASVEDCYVGLSWTVEHTNELGIDPDRIVIIGASAGAGLAAGTALLSRDRGGPKLFGQLLMCPMLDDRNTSASARQSWDTGEKNLWDGLANRVGWQALLGERQDGADVSPYAAPARATDLSGLPPTLVDVASAEVFRSEAVDYAERIWRAGGVADLHVWAGGYHGYDHLAPSAPLTHATMQARHDWLRRLLMAG